jgi:hypothetical protein
MYNHEFDYEHVLDVGYIDGKFVLKLNNFDPIEVPPFFGTQLGDLIYEVIEDSTQKERRRVASVILSQMEDGCDYEERAQVLNMLVESILEGD